MGTTKLLRVLVSVGLLVAIGGNAQAGPIRITCRDGGSRVFYDFNGRQSSERGICDRDGACDGACTFEFFPECVACNLHPTDPYSNEGGCVCFGPESPCNERFVVPVGPQRRIGRLVRTFQQSYAKRFILRCRPARKTCRNVATNTTTTVPEEFDVTGIWAFTTTALEDTCPSGTVSPIETSVRIARFGDHLLGCGAVFHSESWTGTTSSTDFTLALNNTCCAVDCLAEDGTHDGYVIAGTLRGASTPAGSGTLSLTQDWILSSMGGSCPTCRMTWTGTMTRVPSTP